MFCKVIIMKKNNADVKICMICKQYVANENFIEHFKLCRQKFLLKKTKISKTTNNVLKGDCGCKKKK